MFTGVCYVNRGIFAHNTHVYLHTILTNVCAQIIISYVMLTGLCYVNRGIFTHNTHVTCVLTGLCYGNRGIFTHTGLEVRGRDFYHDDVFYLFLQKQKVVFCFFTQAWRLGGGTSIISCLRPSIVSKET